MALEYFDSKGREIRTEVIDGVTRQSFITNANPNEYVTDRQMTGPQDLQSCIRDSRWKTDPAFREAAIAMARQAGEQGISMGRDSSSEMGVLERAMAADNANSDNILEQREAMTILFSDPRYKTSPAFRRYAQEQLRNSDPRHMTDLGGVYRYDAPIRETGQFAPAPKEETGGADRTSQK
jgi:hypothetical protein